MPRGIALFEQLRAVQGRDQNADLTRRCHIRERRDLHAEKRNAAAGTLFQHQIPGGVKKSGGQNQEEGGERHGQ